MYARGKIVSSKNNTREEKEREIVRVGGLVAKPGDPLRPMVA
jgi:hypothetical protein